MAAAVIQEPEVARVTQVEDLPEPVRAELVAHRESGMTLAELKARFSWVAPDVIREVLPPANARERKQRTTREKPRTGKEAAENAKPVGGKVTETTQGVGGRSGAKKSDPKPKAEEHKPAPAPRYVADPGDVPERVVAARKVMGRKDLAEALGISQSACWRSEMGRIHPAELQPLTDALVAVEKRIATGEFKKEEKAKVAVVSKAELESRVDAAVKYLRSGGFAARGSAKNVAVDVLAILDPQVADTSAGVPADKSDAPKA